MTEPAMTPEEWARSQFYDPSEGRGVTVSGFSESVLIDWPGYEHNMEVYIERRPALGALALRGQPFGFTWEDVDDLLAFYESTPMFSDRPRWAANLAARIAALLAPRDVAFAEEPAID